MSPVSQVINYKIAGILGQAIGMKLCDEKGMGHFIKCPGEIHRNGADSTSVV